MREILVATGNPGKAREIREIVEEQRPGLCGLIRWRFLSDFGDLPPAVEDGPDFRANAEIKARHYAQLTGMWTLADDSGLEVDALGGEPGVLSARYAGSPRSDQANNARLISRLAGVPAGQRSARFRCVVVLHDGERTLAEAEGSVEGRIVDEPRGQNGFGYDPHFWIPSAGMTAAELPPERKNAISHRGQALRRLRDQLAEFLGGDQAEAPGRGGRR
jgi:XTP/dITP diphosphohydrolase